MRPHRHDNRVALQQHPPDLHLGSRGDSADGLRGRITGLPGPGRCRHEERHRLWNQTARKTMFICLACELGDGYTPAFCGNHSPEPVSSGPRRLHLAVEFVREHMRRRHPGKAGVPDRLFDLPQQAEPRVRPREVGRVCGSRMTIPPRAAERVTRPECCPVPEYRDTGTMVQTQGKVQTQGN